MLKLFNLFKRNPTSSFRPRPQRHASTVNRPRSEADWAKLRTPPRRGDRRLSDLTLAWLAHLPKQERPVQLCVRYPRVANRIALCWIDGALTARIFISLLLDRRDRRKGFPAPVAYELLRLRALFAARRNIDLKLWEGRELAVADRRAGGQRPAADRLAPMPVQVQRASAPLW